MALAKLPLRIATCRALSGATWANERVFNSSIAPIESTVTDEKGMLFLVVYTDSAIAEPRLDLTDAAPEIELIIHAAVATAFKPTVDGVVVEIGRSDEAFEAVLDIIESQIMQALARGDSEWANLWRSFAPGYGKVHTRRGASARKGNRFAAREISITVRSVADPSGTGDEYPWSEAIDLFADDADLDQVAAILRSSCTVGSDRPDWQVFYQALGLDTAKAHALAFTTAAGEEIVFQ